MGTINGFAIVAERTVRDGIIILGHKQNVHSPSGHEYVVAHVGSLHDHFWSNGDYLFHFDDATERYNTRL